MGRVRKVKKKYNYNKNRKRQWKKSKKKANIECDQLKQIWDEDKTFSQNLQEMGLAVDPNKVLSVPLTKDSLGPRSTIKEQLNNTEMLPPKSYVIAELEEEANSPKERRIKLPESEVLFCTYMLDKYGDDYKAMSHDFRNFYQDTPKQIKKRINAFKNSPDQYSVYLESKQRELCTNQVIKT